ncbi:unnamed protein product [Cylindrotheca closterium]|uniref:AAA+ ATPase domain-containing protein n=1 Tax=Cylindrotheca closterium TaxID=2856 RepID=A0AAD2FVG7_9STRA|nr:unnamed protein product [Cylindrotheca closterium]
MMGSTTNSNYLQRSNGAIFLGSSIVSPVFVEVIPLAMDVNSHQPSFSNFGCKQHLRQLTKSAGFSFTSEDTPGTLVIEWEDATTSTTADGLRSGYLMDQKESTQRVILPGNPKSTPVFFLPSEDPSVLDLLPCCVRVYSQRIRTTSQQSTSLVAFSPACLVRVLPISTARSGTYHADTNRWIMDLAKTMPSWYQQQQLLDALSAESGDEFLSEDLLREVQTNHNEDTVHQLKVRLSSLLSENITISTTADARQLQREQQERRLKMAQAIRGHCKEKQIPLKPLEIGETSQEGHKSQRHPLQWEPSLIIHSPNHADGKTLLVQAIAHTVGCSKIHLIRPGALLAKYGIYADAALESLLHSIVISSAVRGDCICIILDHLDSLMPARLSGRSTTGDAAAPVMNAISSYLRKVTSVLKSSREWPFPVKNPLYNAYGSGGRVLTVKVALVGIVTCPNDGWKSLHRDKGGSSTILESLVGGTYRVQPPIAPTRLRAFATAFENRQIRLDDSAKARLPIAAASAAWAKGAAFGKVARNLESIVKSHIGVSFMVASVHNIDMAMAIAKSGSSQFAQVTFQGTEEEHTAHGPKGRSYFESVGGNVEAKIALENALALDPRKRKALSKFGLAPPVGILLYGPPGCGKTLLAKAVAKLLKAPPSDSSAPSLGGTFISLSSSDIVRAEIGTSEKMVASTFEFADKNAPAVIFLDEFQALFTERSRGGSGKLSTTLLQCLDDIKRWQRVDNFVQENGNMANEQNNIDEQPSNRVIVLAATNTPWMIDSAFLRPGRFDRIVHVGLPKPNERESILRVHIGRMKVEGGADMMEKVCRKLAEATEGFSGADLEALCRSAAVRALMDIDEDPNHIELTERHFEKALGQDVHASSDAELVERLLTWRL